MRHRVLVPVTKLRLKPPNDGPASQDDESSLLDSGFRRCLGALTLVIVVGLGAPVGVAGQAPSGTKTFDPTATDTGAAIKAAAEEAKAATAATKNWTAPRT